MAVASAVVDRCPPDAPPGPSVPCVMDGMETNATTVRMRGPQDLLAYVPFRLGYQPAESVVAVCLCGRQRSVGLVARLDLDAFDGRRGDGRSAAAVAADSLVHLATADGADRVVLVGYTGGDLATQAGPGSRIRRALEAATTAIDVRVPGTEAWLVGPGGYRALDCRDPLCCPATGRPLDDITHSRVAASMVLEGRVVAASRAERLRIVPASPAARRSAGRAAMRWERARPTTTDWGGRTFEDWRRAVRRMTAVEPGQDAELEPVVLGRLAAGLAERRVRDAVLMWIVSGDDDAVLATARGADGPEVDAAAGGAIARIVHPGSSTRPDTERVAPATRVLEAVVAHVPRTRRTGPLTLLGLLAWWSGDGALAGGRIETARAIDPEYTLANLVGRALDAGIPPGWVRQETERRIRGDSSDESDEALESTG